MSAKEPTWYDEILATVPSGIDTAQLERFLKLTPTERIEAMRAVLLALEDAKVRRKTMETHGD